MSFTGFPKETIRFLAGLHKNNNKVWFEGHREDYEAYFMEPAKAFVVAIAPRLCKLDPAINAEPRVNASILRINRDVRFSKDKSPYKDHLDLWFWTGKDRSPRCTSGSAKSDLEFAGHGPRAVRSLDHPIDQL